MANATTSLAKPKVFIYVDGGVAYAEYDSDVEVEIVDFDNEGMAEAREICVNLKKQGFPVPKALTE